MISSQVVFKFKVVGLIILLHYLRVPVADAAYELMLAARKAPRRVTTVAAVLMAS